MTRNEKSALQSASGKQTMHCQNYKGIISASDIQSNTTLLAHMRCKMWSCEYCAAKNRLIWRAHIIDTINRLSSDDHETYGAMRDWTFITLTSHRKMRGEQASLKCLREGWKKLYDRIRRKYGREHRVEYIRVWELHKDGTYHNHAIIGAHIETRWLQDNAAECGMGYKTDAQNIVGHPGRVAAYITKYMTKAIGEYTKGLRRVQGSKAFSLSDKQETKYDWRYMGFYSAVDLLNDLQTTSAVYDLTYKRVLTLDDMGETGYYEPENTSAIIATSDRDSMGDSDLLDGVPL